MSTDPRPFVAAALSGLTTRPVHDMAGPPDKAGRPTVIPGASADAIGKRAVEIGVAAAAAFDAWQLAQGDDSDKPPKRAR